MKRSICLILSFVLLSFPLCVRADNGGDSIECGGEKYIYAFELSDRYKKVASDYIQGEEIYDPDSEEWDDTSVIGRKCFKLSAGDEGYYAVMFDDPECVLFSTDVQEKDGTFKDAESILDEKNDSCGIIFKMNESESEYVFVKEVATGEYSIKSLYLGKDMVSAESAGALVYDYYADAFETVDFTDDKEIDVTEMYPHINLTFSGGERLKISCVCHMTDLRKAGTVTAKLNILDKSFDVDVDYIKPSDLVRKIDFPENFVPSCAISYDGVVSEYNFPDHAVITLEDGKKIEVKRGDRVVLQNGRSYEFWIEYYQMNEGQLTDTVTFSYALNGIMSSDTEITPKCKPVLETFGSVLKTSSDKFRLGKKILSGKVGDWTGKEGRRMIFSFPGEVLTAAKYYAMFGKYLSSLAIILISLSPIIVISVAVIIIIKVRKHCEI